MAIKQPRPVVVDLETFPIRRRPDYPPKPVGVSIKWPGRKPHYYAWGHPSENNCTVDKAREAIQKAYEHPDGVLFHHAKFDTDVIDVHLGIPLPPWQKIHDTLFLLYLKEPNAREHGLKPSAERLLRMPPEERDAVVDWLVENQPVAGVRLGRAPKSDKYAGAYVALAPGRLVGEYANGDVVRTEALFDALWPSIAEAQMLPSYDRERELMPMLLDMDRTGIRVDLKRLRRDVPNYQMIIARLDDWVRNRLEAPGLNVDSGAKLAAAMIEAGVADEALLGVTKTGRIATSKGALEVGVTDRQLRAVLQYLAQLKTCVRTFIEPWLDTAERADGIIYTSWFQTRGDDGGGTRTGRLSSSPNFQNIPKEFEELFLHESGNPELPESPFDLPPLPLCRSYVIPYAEGDALVGRDYSQQEPRILAHFEDGELLKQYQENPWIDYHDNAKEHLERIFGHPFKRKPVKNINLGIIYGQGVPSLAKKNGETVEATKELRDAIYTLYPGLKSMNADMRGRARLNQPIRTWGGRVYYCEPPRLIDGKLKTFDYKLVNTLVQGSAADCTKEAIIRFYRVKPPHYRLLLLVHDELVTSVPWQEIAEGQELLRAAMESVEFDVKILSEGEWSIKNWAEMEKYDKKGVRLTRNPLKVKPNGKSSGRSKPNHSVVSQPLSPVPTVPAQAQAFRNRQNTRTPKRSDGARRRDP